MKENFIYVDMPSRKPENWMYTVRRLDHKSTVEVGLTGDNETLADMDTTFASLPS
jgi:hypothetical protein